MLELVKLFPQRRTSVALRASSGEHCRYIEFINDKKTIEEVIYGQDIRKQASRTASRVARMSSELVSPDAIAKIDSQWLDW